MLCPQRNRFSLYFHNHVTCLCTVLLEDMSCFFACSRETASHKTVYLWVMKNCCVMSNMWLSIMLKQREGCVVGCIHLTQNRSVNIQGGNPASHHRCWSEHGGSVLQPSQAIPHMIIHH